MMLHYSKRHVELVVLSSIMIMVIMVMEANAFTTILPQIRYPVSSNQPLLWMAGGFGGSSSGSAGPAKDKKKKKNKKSGSVVSLKPKQQWDRYGDLKRENKVRVAVRIVGEEDNNAEWLDVGRIKSKENLYTEIAVARQRALIADHAKRLYPLQISNKKTLEWGYCSEEKDKKNDDDEESSSIWTIVDKSILETSPSPEGIEKMIGFEGQPDPATGFYCVYDGGQLKRE